MIDGLFTWGLSALVGVGTATLSYVVGVRQGRERARGDATLDTLAIRADLLAKLDAAERKSRAAVADAERWRSMSLAGAALAVPPASAERATASDAERLVSLARSLVLVDEAVVADGVGLSLSREGGGRAARLAALAAPAAGFSRALGEIGVSVAQVTFETFGAEHVVIRPLGSRDRPSYFVAATTSQAMSPLAVDAIAQAASRGEASSPPASARLLRGATEVRASGGSDFDGVYAELEREVRGTIAGVVLGVRDEVVFASVHDGPGDRARRAVHAELDLLRANVERLPRSSPLARIVVTASDGAVFSWAALAPSSDVSVTFYGSDDARVVERVAGRLRRLVGERALSAYERRAA